MTLFEGFEPLPELFETRVVQTLSKPSGDLDLDLPRLLAGVRRTEHRFQEVGIEHERLEVVADGVHVHVLVNQLDRLRPKGVPQKATSASRWPHGLIDVCKPTV